MIPEGACVLSPFCPAFHRRDIRHVRHVYAQFFQCKLLIGYQTHITARCVPACKGQGQLSPIC